MPLADASASDLSLLRIASFSNFSYPKIRFNENENHKVDANEWFVATAFNRDRWLNNGWDSEPSMTKASEYDDFSKDRKPDFHPGEDWNLNSGADTDRFQRIVAIADGVVVFNGCGYGNTLIVAHRLETGEIITSFYGHMDTPSIWAVGQPVTRGTVIGQIGKTSGSKCKFTPKLSAHLHFEIRKQSMIRIDPLTSAVTLAYPATMWPAYSQPTNGDNGTTFISQNYYSPSEFLLAHRASCFFQIHEDAVFQLWGSNLGVYAPRIAQRFVAPADASVERVNHRIKQFRVPSDAVWLKVYEAGTTPEAGTLIAGPISISANAIPTENADAAYTSFHMPAPITLRTGTTYWFVWGRDTIQQSAYYSYHRLPLGSEFPYTEAWAFDPTGPGWIVVRDFITGVPTSWSLQLCGIIG